MLSFLYAMINILFLFFNRVAMPHYLPISGIWVQFWVGTIYGADRVLSVLFGKLGVAAGQRFGHTFKNAHRAIYPGNVRNLRSEVLRWGYPLPSDTRQLPVLQGHPVSDVWFLNSRFVK